MLEDFYITMPELPSATAVDLYIEERAHLAPKPTGDPAWVLVCVLLGALLLVAAGVSFVVLGATR